MPSLSFVLLMAVEPGFSGQEFIPETYDKIEEIVGFKKVKNLSTIVAVDGGVSPKNIRKLAILGVNQVCVGSAVFDTDEPTTSLEKLYELAED